MNDTGNQAAVEAPGAALAAARQAQNLSVADAARQLKLSVSQIEALEAGKFEKLPGPIFVRGFIRNYARLLKLDADSLLRAVDLVLPVSPAREEVPPSKDIPFPTPQPRRSPWYALALVLLLGGLVAFDYFWNEPEPMALKPVAPPETPVQKVEPSLPAGSRDAEPAKATKVAPEAALAPSAPGAAANTKVADNSMINAPTSGPAAATKASPQRQPGERTLKLVFNQESWVEVRDRNGKIVFSQLNPAGSEKRVHGTPPMSVIIGNAHGVQLTYNNQPVDLALHTKVDVARFTLE